MEKIFNYKKEDWHIFHSYLEKDLCKNNKMWYEGFWFNMGLWFIVAFVFFTFSLVASEFSWPTAGLVAFFFVFIFSQLVLNGIKLKKLCSPSEEGTFIGQHRFKFDEEGIHSEGDGYHAFHNWSVVKRVVKTDKAIYLFLDNALAYIFPLPQLEDYENFYEYIEAKVNVSSSSG